MSQCFKQECPKCYTNRTMLDTSLALPGYQDGRLSQHSGDCINSMCVLPIRVVLCPRCHFVELYHDVGQDR